MLPQENLGLLEPAPTSGEGKAVPRSRKSQGGAGGAGGADDSEPPFPGKKARVETGAEGAPIDLS